MQIVVSTVRALNELAITLIVLIVSQLVRLDSVSMMLPAVVNVWPKNVNGN